MDMLSGSSMDDWPGTADRCECRRPGSPSVRDCPARVGASPALEQPRMRRALALALVAALPAAAKAAPPRWTFCVAASEGGTDVWISEVFQAEGARERFEMAF